MKTDTVYNENLSFILGLRKSVKLVQTLALVPF